MKINKSAEGIAHFTIIKILSKFTPAEMNEFEKLLKSPFYNNHSTILKLFIELKKYYPHFDNPKLTRGHLFSAAGSGKKYDDKLFIKYLSRMNKLAEEYLNILQTREEKNQKDLNVLMQLSKKNLNLVFSIKLKKIEKFMETESMIDDDVLLIKHKLSQLKYVQNLNDNLMASHNEHLVNSFEYLLSYFLTFSVSNLTQIISNKISYQKSEEENNLTLFFNNFKFEEFVKELKSGSYKWKNENLLVLEITLNDLIMSTSEQGYKSYTILSKLIHDNSEHLSKDFFLYYLQRLNIFCLVETLKGNRDMNRELLGNYKMILDNNLFYIDGKSNLTLLNFRLILLTALKCNEFLWAEKFVNDNIINVKEEIRTNVRHYSDALLMFYKKNYQESLSHISKIKSESLPITIDIYILKSKIFYMMGYDDSAIDVADSFRHFITGHKHISDFHKENLMNFLKYFKKILKLKSNKDRLKLKALLDELRTSVNTKDKKWMIETVEDLTI